MNRFHALSLITIVITGCSGPASRTGSAAVTDSTAVAEASAPKITLLPDTIYPSAEAVSFRVVVKDSAIAGEIDPAAEWYAGSSNIFTFRGNLRRDADYGGRVEGTPSEITVDWVFHTELDSRKTDFGTWGGGTGWTGQPLYVEWPDEALKRFKEAGHMADDASGREIIVGSLASQIYFIDYATGKASRRPLPTRNPIKGTVSLDPSLNGNLYVGQGVPAERPFGALTFNLFSHTLTDTFGEDAGAERRWGAYDSSPVRVGNFVFRPGENGTVYKWHVGTDGKTTLHSLLRYRINGAAPGIESSMAVWRNYGYTADNHGNIVCINLMTMKPVWVYNTGDDSDATPVLAEENDGHMWLYVASEIDRQGTGTGRFAKLDALDGKPAWERRIEGKRYDSDGKHFDGGFYGSPLPGQGKSSHLIFANFVANTDGQNGRLIAFDRKDGHTVWERSLRYYAWTSPVGFLNENGEMFILDGDCAGNLYLVNADDGSVITRKAVGNNFESSAAVVGNTAVIGSRGNSIYRISLK